MATRQLAAPVSLWFAADCFSAERALQHAFCIADPSEPVNAFCKEERVAWADRYGGPGVGYSGGSGRCATVGDIQVKGIGRTPLVTKKVDPFHSNGLVGVEEAVREIVWSEIAHLALPFGAVRTLGALDTGTTFPVPGAEGGVSMRKRILLLREWTLRPAHYMRNVHFETAFLPRFGVVEDAVRTAAAVQSLEQVFRLMFASCKEAGEPIEVINTGLREIAQRYACQVATASSKRIYHGGLTPSNIALDGRYLDFGTITAVPSGRRRAIRPLEPDCWNEHALLLNTLIELRFYIGKYATVAAKEQLVSVQELAAIFTTAFDTTQRAQLLRRTGVPAAIAARFPVEKSIRFQRCVLQIQRRRASEPFVNWTGGGGVATPPSRAGLYQLEQVLTSLALCTDQASRHECVSRQLDDQALARELALLYGDLVSCHEDSLGDHLAVRRARLLRGIDAMRMNADVAFLGDTRLNSDIGRCDLTAQGMAAFVVPTVARAAEILADRPDFAHQLDACLDDAGGAVDGHALLTVLLPANVGHLPAASAANLEVLWKTAR